VEGSAAPTLSSGGQARQAAVLALQLPFDQRWVLVLVLGGLVDG